VANQLTGANNLVVGAPLTSGTGATIGRMTGAVVLNTAQNYTGETTINVGSSLQFRGQVTTSGFDVFGNNNDTSANASLIAGGVGGRFLQGVGAAATAIPVTFHAGSMVQLDNSFDLLPNTSDYSQGRWSDTAAFTLDSSVFKLVGNGVVPITEQVGAATIHGGSIITSLMTPTGTSPVPTTFSFANIVQSTTAAGDNGSVSIEPTTAGQLGQFERIMISVPGNVPTVSPQGIVPTWMWNQRENSFLTYNTTSGFNNAAFTVTNTTVTALGGVGTGNEIYWNKPGAGTLLAGTSFNVYALRTDNSITLSTTTDSAANITIASGGLITGAASISLTPKLIFGSTGTPKEADIHVSANTTTIGDNTTSNANTAGQIIASNIVKDGTGTLVLTGEQQTFAGGIAVDGGSLTLNNNTASNAGASNAGGKGGTIFLDGYNTALNLNAGGTTTAGSFNSNIFLAAGNPLATITVNRVGTAASGQQVMIGGNGGLANTGNLTFGGASGDQGQTLIVSNGNTMTFRVNGSTFLGTNGNITFVNNTDTFLAGPIAPTTTQTAGQAINVVKEGGSNLYLDAGTTTAAATQSSTFVGGFTVLNGGLVSPGVGGAITSGASIIGVGAGFNPLGNNNTVTMVGGTLLLRGDDDNTATFSTITYNTNNIVVNGNSTITVDRTGAQTSETTKLVQIQNLTMGAETLTVTAGNSYRFGVAGTMTMTASSTLSLSADMSISGSVVDNGAGLSLIKQGGSTLWFNTTSSSFTGPLIVEQGAIRFGNTTTASTTSTAGLASSMILDPGASVQLQAATNISAGQKIDVRSGNFTTGTGTTTGIGLGYVQLNTVIDPTALAPLITSSSTGALLINVATYNPTNPLTISAIGAGNFQIAGATAMTYSPTSLGAGANGTWVVGGNGVNFTFLAANTNTLTGANRLQAGSLLLSGGSVVMNTSNNYTGGTVDARGTGLNWSTGGTNTPLGTGQVDLFGTATASSAALFTQNTFVIHPGATVAMTDATFTANRWGSATPMALNGASLSYTAGVAGSNTQAVGNLTIAGGTRINFTGTANAGVINVGPAGAGTFTRTAGASLVFTTNSAGSLGTAGASGAEVFITGGGPALATIAGGGTMAAGYFVDGSANTFVNYGGTGFIDVPYTTAAANLPAGLTGGNAVAQMTTTGNVTLADNPSI
jgi:autotransporter-associated beta strand protein